MGINPALILQVCAVLGWTGLGFGFYGPTGAKSARPTRAWSSVLGIAVQGAAGALAWGWRRGSGPFITANPALDWMLVPIAIVLTVFADWLIYRAVRELGKQWSLEARVLEDHQLVTTGPYAIVRNPIYTGIYALLIVTGCAFSTWPSVLLTIVLYWIGTAVRVSSEEQLLRSKFGAVFEAYVGRVPAIIPRII